MSRKTTVGKSISLEPVVLQEGVDLARRRGFKNSFSAYVAWLIEQDKQRQDEVSGTQPEPKEVVNG